MLIAEKIKKLFSRIEAPQMHLSYCVVFFISAVILRNFLEIFSDKAYIAFSLIPAESPKYALAGYSIAIAFLHYFMFWLVFLLSVSLIFRLLTKENTLKILKVTMSFSLILILTPGLDLLFSAGNGFDIRYSYPKNLLDILPLPSVVTPGMIIAIITGLVLSFLYCYIKTGKVIKGLLAVIGFYLTGQLLGSLPAIIEAYHPLEILRFLAIVFFIELIFFSFLTDKKYASAIFKDLRFMRISHYWSMFLLGILLAKPHLWSSVKNEEASFILTLISIALAWVASVVFNNIFDIEIDRVSNAQRPLIRNLIPLELYTNIGCFVSFLAMFLAFCVNISTLFIIMLCLGNSFLYSAPPFRFKKIPVFSKIFLSVNSLALVMLGTLFAGKDLLSFPKEITLFFILITTITFNFIDLKDYEGDKMAGIRTLPGILGLQKSKLILGAAFTVTYACFGLILLNLGLVAAGLIFGIAQFYFINKKIYSEKIILLTHLTAIVLLLTYLNFY